MSWAANLVDWRHRIKVRARASVGDAAIMWVITGEASRDRSAHGRAIRQELMAAERAKTGARR